MLEKMPHMTAHENILEFYSQQFRVSVNATLVLVSSPFYNGVITGCHLKREVEFGIFVHNKIAHKLLESISERIQGFFEFDSHRASNKYL